jgi:threonylcarbamoyladenosine tRNA methylthiotransferase MtaB
MSTPSAPQVITFGCRLNLYESEAITKVAEQDGLTDAIIINSCAVTSEAVRQARQAARRAKRDNPDKLVIVTGCAAQTEPERFSDIPEVDFILGNDLKARSGTYRFLGNEPKVRINDIFAVREYAPHMVDGLKDRARAFVEVQNGCDHRCTFCIIPYGRGNSRSVPAGDVVAQVSRLADMGFHEVVLTGVDLTSWGADLPAQPSLGHLVSRILKMVPHLDRLRLSSIDAAEIDESLLMAFATEERLAPYLHLSLQHGDNLILKRMKRRHSREDAVNLVAKVRSHRSDVAFGADLIAGFPTETDEAFENSLSLIDELSLSYVHVFPFSARPMTPAAKMPRVEGKTIKERAARLRAHGGLALDRHLLSRVGMTMRALVERKGRARADDFTEIDFDGEANIGKPCHIKITGHAQGRALGVIVSPVYEEKACLG